MTSYRIEKKESFRVIGHALHTTNQKGEGKKAIPLHWEAFQKNHMTEELLRLTKPKEEGLLGINIYNVDAQDARKFTYLIAVSSDAPLSEGMEEYIVAANTWAIFPCTKETVGKTEAMAITKWLPKSNYRPLNKGYLTGRMKSAAPDIEHYAANGQVEVWIAVKEK